MKSQCNCDNTAACFPFYVSGLCSRHPRYIQLIAPFGMPHLVSGINFLLLSINVIPAPLSLSSMFIVHAPTTSSHPVNSPLSPSVSLSLSLPTQDLPPSQIIPTIDSLPASGLTPRTSWLDRFFWAARFFVSSLLFFCSVPCSRLSWLLVSFWAHVNIVHRIVSYRACR